LRGKSLFANYASNLIRFSGREVPMKKRKLLLVVAFAAIVGLVGVAGLSQSLLRVGFSWPTYIDPAVGFDFSSSSAIVNLYDSLVYPTADGTVVAHAATSWTVSDDNLTYTFNIRPGIMFHTGGEMTAEDVKFSMDRLLAIGEGYSYLFRGKVSETNVVDTYTVEFKLGEPFGPFLFSLVRFYIVSKDAVMANLAEGPYGDYGDYGKEYLQYNDAGSAAYTVADFQFEEYLLLDKFDGYWGTVAADAADQVKMLRSPDTVTVKTLMARKELEITDPWQPEEAMVSMAENEGVEIAAFPNSLSQYLMLHNTKAPTDDIHIRKALSYMLDYDQVVNVIFPGSLQAYGPVASVLPGYAEGLYQYSRNLDKAMEELQKSKYYGQLEDYPIVFGVNTDVPALEKLGLLFQANAAEIGLDVELITMPWGKMVEVVGSQEDTPNVLAINVAPHYPEAGSMLQAKYHSANAGTWEQAEWMLDPAVDQLIDGALATVDETERFQKYALIQELMVELAPDVFLFELLEKHAYQASYVTWPQPSNPNPVMGYNYDFRFIEIFPDQM